MAQNSVVVKIDGDDSGFKKSLSGIGNVAKKGLGFAVKGIAATSAAFGTMSAVALKSYSEFEQLSGGIETLFGARGAKSVEEYAEIVGESVEYVAAEYEMLQQAQSTAMVNASEAYKTAGMSANEYMEISTGLAAALNQSTASQLESAELANQAIIDMSDNANKMGTDIELIKTAYQGFSKQNYTMLDNLKLGFGGTKEEMQRLLEEAEKISGIKYDISSFADITEAIHVMQVEMGIAGTTAKEASTTIQGSVNQMKGAWENLMVGLVDSNADLPKLIDDFVDSVVIVFENLIPAVSDVFKSLPKLITKLSQQLIKTLPGMFKDFIPATIDGAFVIIETLVDALAKNAYKIGEGMAQLAQLIITKIIEIAPKMLEAGGEIIKGLITGITGANPALTAAVTATMGIFAALQIAPIVTSVINGFKGISTVLTAYQAATAASSSVSVLLASTMTPLQLIIGVLTGKVTLATAAQVAWNAVLNANPVILFITAIVALTGAVVGLGMAYDAHLEKSSLLVQSTKAMAEASIEAAEKARSLKESMESLNETAETTIADAEAQAYANEKLADELFDLSEKENLTNAEKERMKVLVDELNENVGGLNLKLDEERGLLNLTRQEVSDLIQEKLEMAKVNAIQDLYTEQLKKQYQAQAETIDSAKKMKAAQEELNQIYEEATFTYTDLDGSIKETTILNAEQRAAVENLETAIAGYSDTIAANETTVRDSQTAMENLATAAGVDLPESFQKAKTETEGFYDGIKDTLNQSESDGEQAGEYLGGGYAAGIAAQKGPVYSQAYALAVVALQGVADGQASASPSKKAANLGNDFSDGYALGVEDNLKKTKRAGEKLATTALKAVQKTQDSHSPAKETEDLGEDFTDGYVDGIGNNIDSVEQAAADAANASLGGVLSAITESADPISSAIESLVKDTRTEVQKVVDELNEELLESEKLYADESIRLKDSKSEADREYLETLKKTAEEERKIYDAQQKDMENNREAVRDHLEARVEEYRDIIEDLKDAQESLSDALKDEGNNTYTKKEVTITSGDGSESFSVVELADVGSDVDKLNTYNDLIDQLFERRGDLPKEVMQALQGMGVEEGTEYITAMLSASDEEFDAYIAALEEKEKTAAEISKKLYADEVNAVKESFEQEFGQLPEDFFGFGEDAAILFGEGFLEQLETVMTDISATISASFDALLPDYVTSGIGNVPTANTTYNNTYNVQPAPGESTADQLRAIKQEETVAELRGDYN